MPEIPKDRSGPSPELLSKKPWLANRGQNQMERPPGAGLDSPKLGTSPKMPSPFNQDKKEEMVRRLYNPGKK